MDYENRDEDYQDQQKSKLEEWAEKLEDTKEDQKKQRVLTDALNALFHGFRSGKGVVDKDYVGAALNGLAAGAYTKEGVERYKDKEPGSESMVLSGGSFIYGGAKSVINGIAEKKYVQVAFGAIGVVFGAKSIVDYAKSKLKKKEE